MSQELTQLHSSRRRGRQTVCFMSDGGQHQEHKRGQEKGRGIAGAVVSDPVGRKALPKNVAFFV